MSELTIITTDDAYRKAKSGEALLVCAYEDDDRFGKFNLDEAISYKTFESLLPTISKDREIIFYCA
jgi:hypothetical protein